MSPRTLLSSEQRVRLFSIPTDPAEMTRHYVLGADDLALVGARRRASNRLGFAVQLCALRHPGGMLEVDSHPKCNRWLENSSAGVLKPRHFRGVALQRRAMASIWRGE